MIPARTKQTAIFTAAMLLSAGIILPVIAETPPLGLPPLPGAPQAPSAPSAPAAPDTSFTPKPATTPTAEAAKPTLPVTPPLPNESADRPASATTTPVDATTANASAPPATPALPALDLQAPPPTLPATTPVAKTNAPFIPAITPLPVAIAPKKDDTKEKEKTPTWLTKLEPSVKIPRLGYQYRREVLPTEIYRRSYNLDNHHLPVLTTREDYIRWFLVNVARNDINTTRAFLNEGISPNTTNANGESALSIAQRYHANDTARLLIARGAY